MNYMKYTNLSWKILYNTSIKLNNKDKRVTKLKLLKIKDYFNWLKSKLIKNNMMKKGYKDKNSKQNMRNLVFWKNK